MGELFKEDNDLDFEIRFIEGILKHNPRYVEGLTILGDYYTRQGEYYKGLDVDEKLSVLCPEDPVVFYNLACSYALVRDIDKAFRSVKKAVRLGYHNFEHLEQDPDLENLRHDRRFQEYLMRLKKHLSRASHDMEASEASEEFAQGSDEILS